MQPRDPVFVGVIGVRRQAVDGAIFGGPALVSKTVPQVDRDGSHLGDLLETGWRGFRERVGFGCPTFVPQCLPCSLPLAFRRPYDNAGTNLRRCGLARVLTRVTRLPGSACPGTRPAQAFRRKMQNWKRCVEFQGCMILPPESPAQNPPQFPGKARRIVSVDGQPAAFFRAVDGERPDDDMAAGPDACAGAPVGQRSAGSIRKWKAARSCQMSKVCAGDHLVTSATTHSTCRHSPSRVLAASRAACEISSTVTPEPARDQAIDQARCAAADIDDGGIRRRPGKVDQFERRRGSS